MVKRLVVFDCDGTLVDSGNGIAAAMTAAFNKHGLADPTRQDILRQVGLPGHVMAARICPDLSKNDCHLIERHYVQMLRAERAEGVLHPLYDGIRDLLEALHGHSELAIATGMGRPGLDFILDGHALHRVFSSLQTADVNPGKPNPAMLLAAMTEVGANPADTIMVGDTSHDAKLAENAGVEFLGVSWGFHDRHELMDAGAINVASSVNELSSYLAATSAGK